MALVMPHFSSVLEDERNLYRAEISDVLTNKFMNNGKVHEDVYWRNIGKYKSTSGSVVLVLYDLHNVVDFKVDKHVNWIENAMNSLYNGPSE